MYKILVIRLYFLLDALHDSDYVSPSSEATFYKLYIAFGICRYKPIRLAVVWLWPHNSQTYGTGMYQMQCTAYKVASDDGLI